VLDPGRYELRVEAYAGSLFVLGFPTAANWSFDFAAVPEPSAGLLLTMAMLALAVSRR